VNIILNFYRVLVWSIFLFLLVMYVRLSSILLIFSLWILINLGLNNFEVKIHYNNWQMCLI
jgi:hypothetical protein